MTPQPCCPAGGFTAQRTLAPMGERGSSSSCRLRQEEPGQQGALSCTGRVPVGSVPPSGYFYFGAKPAPNSFLSHCPFLFGSSLPWGWSHGSRLPMVTTCQLFHVFLWERLVSFGGEDGGSRRYGE